MGNGSNPGEVPDVNYFATQRNDIPAQPAQPNGLQAEYLQGQQPGAHRRTADCHDGFVTVKDHGHIYHLAAGSTLDLDGDGQVRRVGSGQNGYIPTDTVNQAAVTRQAQTGGGPYYAPVDTTYQPQRQYSNVDGAGWQVPPPFQPVPQYNINPVGAVLGAIGSIFLGAHFGGRGGYGYGYGGYHPPFRPPFIPHRGGGVSIGFGVQPSWNYANNNYYNPGGYYGAQQQASYVSSQYDANGNPIYSS
jgi:hypothetical protein